MLLLPLKLELGRDIEEDEEKPPRPPPPPPDDTPPLAYAILFESISVMANAETKRFIVNFLT
jgi:hypothetical protein